MMNIISDINGNTDTAKPLEVFIYKGIGKNAKVGSGGLGRAVMAWLWDFDGGYWDGMVTT